MALHRSQKLNLLRLAVLLTVALAGIKFFFRDSFTLDQRREVSGEGHFWGSALDVKQTAGAQERSLAHPDHKPAAGASGPELRKMPRRDFSSTQMRLVHLDLKGAAPKVSYLEQIFPLFSKMGANGVLIEYEDMFPFKGELEILRSPYAYSEEDIVKIQELAGLNKLEIIPLVQTFGHVEAFFLPPELLKMSCRPFRTTAKIDCTKSGKYSGCGDRRERLPKKHMPFNEMC